MNLSPTRTAALALTILGVAAAPAAAKTEHYSGKTSEGTKISFVVAKGWVDRIQSSVPTTCVSAQGGNPRVTITSWDAPYKFRLGAKAKVETTSGITRHYSFDSHRRGNRVVGAMSINYSLLGTDGFGGYRILTCYGTARFSLKPRG